MRLIKPEKKFISYTGKNPIVPTTIDKKIPKNTFLDNDLIVKGAYDLESNNIKKGAEIFGVEGSFGQEFKNHSLKFYLSDYADHTQRIVVPKDYNDNYTPAIFLIQSVNFSFSGGIVNTMVIYQEPYDIYFGAGVADTFSCTTFTCGCSLNMDENNYTIYMEECKDNLGEHSNIWFDGQYTVLGVYEM